jgi:hypothetical protein
MLRAPSGISPDRATKISVIAYPSLPCVARPLRSAVGGTIEDFGADHEQN